MRRDLTTRRVSEATVHLSSLRVRSEKAYSRSQIGVVGGLDPLNGELH